MAWKKKGFRFTAFRGFRCRKRQGRAKPALPHRLSPHLDARVAPQRSPILRVGRKNITQQSIDNNKPWRNSLHATEFCPPLEKGDLRRRQRVECPSWPRPCRPRSTKPRSSRACVRARLLGKAGHGPCIRSESGWPAYLYEEGR